MANQTFFLRMFDKSSTEKAIRNNARAVSAGRPSHKRKKHILKQKCQWKITTNCNQTDKQ